MIELISTESRPSARSVSLHFVRYVFFCLCFLVPAHTFAQSVEAKATGELIINAETKVNGEKVVLKRKRFYLIKGGVDENKALVDKIIQQSSSFPTRDCFYRNAKASEAFINWLREVDCESVYCQPIEEKFLAGSTAIPEFEKAFKLSAREYKSPELGRLWLATNLSDVIRDGFYRYKLAALKTLIGETQTDATTRDNSVMTDRNGQAYFTGLEPGTYLVSNLTPIELGGRLIVWTCEVRITSGKNALDIPSVDDSSKTDSITSDKCSVWTVPSPVCNANKQSTSIR